ncbi:MAG TPA: hypothetical protein VIV11_35895 [Kofleriaceae bacterium]
MRVPVVLALCSACRIGFDAAEDSGFQKPLAGDAALGIDSPPGSGSYTLVDTTAPYVGLVDSMPLEGFLVDDDDENYTATLPFVFELYSVTYDTITINTNGYVTFTTPLTGVATAENQCPFTPAAPDAMIALLWDDLYASPIAPVAAIVSATAGTAPNRTFSVEWRNMDAFYAQGGSFWTQEVIATQQLVLHESGVIEMHYGPRTGGPKERDCGLERHLGCSATVGLEGAGGGPVELVQCGTAAGPMAGYSPLVEGRLLRFTPD